MIETNDRRWWDREPTRPLPVDGGIKARSKRGVIGQRWWSARFIATLDALGVGGRLDRGRSYARAGQVMDLRVSAGTVVASVQGSRPKPYRVRLGVQTYGKTEWSQVEQFMADSAWYAAKMLSGDMPEDIEGVFASVGLNLFPASLSDLTMDCDCPDRVVPCKHLAAVCYLLAESFDDDPFAILALRGRDRETLLDNIRARRPTGSSPDAGEYERLPAELDEAAPPLERCLDDYFVLSAPLPVLPALPSRPGTALDQLPPVRLSIRGRQLADLLLPAYQTLADPE